MLPQHIISRRIGGYPTMQNKVGFAVIPAALSSLFGTMEAPFGAPWAWVGIGEVPAPATFAGGGMVRQAFSAARCWSSVMRGDRKPLHDPSGLMEAFP